MPKDREQMTPAEPEDVERLERRNDTGDAAPGGSAAGGDDPAAVDELPDDQREDDR